MKFKQGILMIVLTTLAFYYREKMVVALHSIQIAEKWLITKTIGFLPHIPLVGALIPIIILLILPVFIALIPSYIYWFVKREQLPFIKQVILLLWAILLTIYLM